MLNAVTRTFLTRFVKVVLATSKSNYYRNPQPIWYESAYRSEIRCSVLALLTVTYCPMFLLCMIYCPIFLLTVLFCPMSLLCMLYCSMFLLCMIYCPIFLLTVLYCPM